MFTKILTRVFLSRAASFAGTRGPGSPVTCITVALVDVEPCVFKGLRVRGVPATDLLFQTKALIHFSGRAAG